METRQNDTPWSSAVRIAGAYSILGILWILFSDRLVQQIARSESQLTFLQSAKGVGFIVFSAIIIFFLTYLPLKRLTESNAKLEAALDHSSRLHRILRHNLRNSCQTIAGFAELLREESTEADRSYIRQIEEHTERLISLSRKSIYFHDFLSVNPENRTRVDVVRSIREEVQAVREGHEGVRVSLSSPDEAYVYAHYHLEEAFEELLENAVVYNESDEPHVWVSVQSTPEDVVIAVADDGPGIPPVERLVLERKTETQTEHSQGLGLWLIYLTVHHSDGSFDIMDNRHGGTTIEITLPRA